MTYFKIQKKYLKKIFVLYNFSINQFFFIFKKYWNASNTINKITNSFETDIALLKAKLIFFLGKF